MRIVLLAALVVMGCSSDTKTLGDLCDAVGDAICSRVQTCGFQGYDACFQATKTSCCLRDGTCGAKADGHKLGECTDAIGALSCDAVKASTVPAVCLME